MLIDFTPIQTGTRKLAELQHEVTHADLIRATHEMIDTMLSLIEEAKDSYVTFQPIDLKAHDSAAINSDEVGMAWTLGHVIVHTTASGEEAASIGSSLARGVLVEWRDRYEVPWQNMETIADLHHRLEESRRIRLAYLNAWPDEPHLEVLWRKKDSPKGILNAIGYTLSGLKHDADHINQIAEIIQQAREILG